MYLLVICCFQRFQFINDTDGCRHSFTVHLRLPWCFTRRCSCSTERITNTVLRVKHAARMKLRHAPRCPSPACSVSVTAPGPKTGNHTAATARGARHTNTETSFACKPVLPAQPISAQLSPSSSSSSSSTSSSSPSSNTPESGDSVYVFTLAPPLTRFCPNRAFCVAGAPDFRPTSSASRGKS